MLIKLAVKSLRDRKGSVILSIIAMTVSIFVLLGVEHIRYQTKESFANTVSGTDLIVGARTGSLNLLLYSVFKIDLKFSFLIDKNSQPFLEGMTLDYIKEGLNEFFKFINPNEQSACGCGVSVQFNENINSKS